MIEGSIDLDEQRQEVMRELKVVTQCSCYVLGENVQQVLQISIELYSFKRL